MSHLNPKNELLQWFQARAIAAPTFGLPQVAGPPHEPHFTVVVSHSAWSRSYVGTGSTRKDAEKAAARAALDADETLRVSRRPESESGGPPSW